MSGPARLANATCLGVLILLVPGSTPGDGAAAAVVVLLLAASLVVLRSGAAVALWVGPVVGPVALAHPRALLPQFDPDSAGRPRPRAPGMLTAVAPG